MTDRAQIAHGLAEYVRNDLMQAVPDMPLKIALGTISRMLELNPGTLDKLLGNQVIAMLVPAVDGGFDLMPALNALADTMRTAGPLPVTIPAIPFLTKGESTLTFTPADIDRIRQYIGG